MNHFMHARGALRFRNTPLLSGRPHQHQARRSACLAQRIEKTPHRMRPICVLISIFFIAGGLYDFHSRPIGIQFLGHNSRQRRLAPASHFGAMRHDVRRSVRIDRQVNAGRKRSLEANVRDSRRCSSRSARSKCFARQIVRCQHERSSANHPAQKIAPAGSHIVFMQRVDCFAVTQRNIFDGDHKTLRFFGDLDTSS